MSDINPTIINDVISVTVDSTENIVTVTSYDTPTVVVDFINHAGTDTGSEPAITPGTTSQYWRGDKTWQDFSANVRSSVLTGLSLITNAVISASDTVLSALGKLQKQISDNLTTLTNHTGNTSNPHSVTANQVLPSQTGNNRKHLQTDGTNTSWGNNFDNIILDNVVSPSNPSINTQLVYAKSDGIYTKNENGIEIGISSLTVVPRNTSFQLGLSDIDTLQNVTNTCDITVPTFADVAIPIGSMIVVVADTIMTVKFVAALGVTINKEIGLTLNAQYAVAGIIKMATDTWIAFGSLKV